MTVNELVDAYFAAIRVRDIDGLGALYDEDATFLHPFSGTFHGRPAIIEMHKGIFAANSPAPAPVSMIVAGDMAAVEIEATMPDGSVRTTANFYQATLEGRIGRISVYMRTR